MKARLLVVLQNPWKRGILRNGYNPKRWWIEYNLSRSGRRLAQAIPVELEWEVRYTNANPKMTELPTETLPPDLVHLRRTLKRVKPDIVLACGRLAERAILEVWQGPVIAVPHPAYRVVTDDLYEKARFLLRNWFVFQKYPHWRSDITWGGTSPCHLRPSSIRIATTKRIH